MDASPALSDRVAWLLRQMQGMREDLAGTANPDARAALHADIEGLEHSLWLAGYEEPLDVV